MATPLFNALNGQQTNPMSQLVTEARRLKQTMQKANPMLNRNMKKWKL